MAQRISGSTKIVELIVMYPNGRAVELMARLGWPCGQCGARQNEPLSLAAKRHGNPTGAIIDAFRALTNGGPSERQVMAAASKTAERPSIDATWRQHAR